MHKGFFFFVFLLLKMQVGGLCFAKILINIKRLISLEKSERMGFSEKI